MKYWRESIEISLNEMGVSLSDAQIDQLAGDIEIAFENRSLAFGPCDNGGLREIEQRHEREKKKIADDAENARAKLEKEIEDIRYWHRQEVYELREAARAAKEE